MGSAAELEFPTEIQCRPLYGNCVVAKRLIYPGETICQDTSLLTSPRGPENKMPFCLTCCKSISDNNGNMPNVTCSKCKWPFCDTQACQNNLNHEAICDILAKGNVKYDGTFKAYLAIGTLTGLLFKDKIETVEKWNKILNFEAHRKKRDETEQDREVKKYVINFIKACGIKEEEGIIDHVLGATVVNTYWTEIDPTTEYFASFLYDIGSIFAHSCDPNTKRRYIFPEDEDNVDRIRDVILHVEATKKIEAGEMITISYIFDELEQDVVTRRKHLKKLYYFDCQCHRCSEELKSLNL